MNTRDFYLKLLKSLWIKPNERGELAPTMTPDVPLRVEAAGPEGPALSLPAEGEDAPVGTLKFDPLNDVGKDFQCVTMGRRFAMVTSSQILGLFLVCCTISIDPERQKRLSNEGGKLLSKIGSVDENTLKFATQLISEYLKKHSKNPTLSLARYTSVVSRQIQGVTFTRVGVYTCPLYDFIRDDELRKENPLFGVKGQYRVLGVSCRKNDLIALREFIKAVFPNLNTSVDVSPWKCGTKSSYGNHFFSLAKVFCKVIAHINGFKKSMGVGEDSELVDWVKLDWEEDLTELMSLDRSPASAPTLKQIEVPKTLTRTLGVDTTQESSKKKVRTFSDLPDVGQAGAPNARMFNSTQGAQVKYLGDRPVVIVDGVVRELTDQPSGGVNQRPMMVAPTPVEGTLELDVQSRPTMLFTDGVKRAVMRDPQTNRYVSAQPIATHPPGMSPRAYSNVLNNAYPVGQSGVVQSQGFGGVVNQGVANVNMGMQSQHGYGARSMNVRQFND